MAYQKENWVNVSDPANPPKGATPINAEIMDKIEQGIMDAFNRIEEGVSEALHRTDEFIAYLNSSPLTLKRDKTGAIVSHREALGEGSDIFVFERETGETYNISKSSMGIFTFDFVRPDYSVPSIDGVFTIGTIKSSGGSSYTMEQQWLKNNYLNIRDSNGNVVATSEVKDFSYGNLELKVDLSSLSNGIYTVDYYSTLICDSSNTTSSTFRKYGALIEISLSSSHYERNLIEFVGQGGR